MTESFNLAILLTRQLTLDLGESVLAPLLLQLAAWHHTLFLEPLGSAAICGNSRDQA